VIVIGMGLGWVGYAMLFYGYSLVKGYDLSFSQVVSPKNYYKGSWPPAPAGNAVIFPSGKTVNASTASTNATTHNVAGNTTPSPGGTCPPGYTYNPKSKKCVPPAAM
jgi:hypothetical protein